MSGGGRCRGPGDRAPTRLHRHPDPRSCGAAGHSDRRATCQRHRLLVVSRPVGCWPARGRNYGVVLDHADVLPDSKPSAKMGLSTVA